MKLSRLIRYVSVIFAVCFLTVGLLPRPSRGASTLADAISSVLSSAWAQDPASISIGTIFGKDSLSAFDSATGVSTSVQQKAWLREIASEDGYSSQTIDNYVKSNSFVAMVGSLPQTYNGMWLAYDRSFIPLYDLLGWSKSAAITQLQQDLKADSGQPLLAFGSPGASWYYAERYYDEWIEDLDIFVKMGDTATAATLWAGVNQAPPNGNWEGSDYCYRADQAGVLECEVGFFAAVIANYKETVGSIPNFDRISTDLYTKLLASGWSSPLWGAPSAMQHATVNPQLRLENTLGGIEALQMYYCVSGSAYRTAFVNLLTAGTPAWQYLMGNVNWGSSSSDDAAEKAALLFLYGVIPDTGSLAVPTNEWRYEDWTSMMPSTLFKFDYGTHTIQIPVHAGNIKFDFGSSIASYNFPSDGVYRVQFSSDWNTVTSANSVGGLTQYNFLGGSSPPPPGSGSIQVTGTSTLGGDVSLPVSFEAWYDSSSHVTVPSSGTYTFTNVPSGSHTVYGLYSGVQKSASVTVSQGQTASSTFDFSSPAVNTARPLWWPAPLPWPLPGYLSTIVSSAVDMFAGGVAFFVLVVIGLSRLKKSKPKLTPRKKYVIVEDS
jgi:hypothetical protein